MTAEHQAWLQAAAKRDAAEEAWQTLQAQLRAAREALSAARDEATAALASLRTREDARLLRELQAIPDGWFYQQYAPGRFQRWTVRVAAEPRFRDRCEVQEASASWRSANGRTTPEPGPDATYTLGCWGVREDYAISKTTSRELRTQIAQQSKRSAS